MFFSAIFIHILAVLVPTVLSTPVAGRVSGAVARWQHLLRSTRIEGNRSLLLQTQVGGQPSRNYSTNGIKV
jgi:hypothetical protein